MELVGAGLSVEEVVPDFPIDFVVAGAANQRVVAPGIGRIPGARITPDGIGAIASIDQVVPQIPNESVAVAKVPPTRPEGER
jgi:hypothetical protein